MFFNLGSPPQSAPPPFAAWTSRYLRILEKAIMLAWNDISTTPHGAAEIASATEVAITSMLQDALVDVLASGRVRGFSIAVFSVPVRGQELEDYSGKFLEKRPDLTFQRHSARPIAGHNAMFYECKVLGSGRTALEYIKKGVARFEQGAYAWAMPQAGMIGYVVGGHASNAKAVLSASWSDPTKPAPHSPLNPMVEDSSSAPTVAISIHARQFILRNGQNPGDIVLRHLWLT